MLRVEFDLATGRKVALEAADAKAARKLAEEGGKTGVFLSRGAEGEGVFYPSHQVVVARITAVPAAKPVQTAMLDGAPETTATR